MRKIQIAIVCTASLGCPDPNEAGNLVPKTVDVRFGDISRIDAAEKEGTK